MSSESHVSWTFNVSGTLGDKYLPVVEDVFRTIVIQLTVQLLIAAVDGDRFFSGSFFLVLMYILLGTITYHLIVKALVKIK